MKLIEYETIGQILEGEHKGWFVEVRDDSENTGGFLIIIYDDIADCSQAFDSWVETEKGVEQYFKDSAWQVAWSGSSRAEQ